MENGRILGIKKKIGRENGISTERSKVEEGGPGQLVNEVELAQILGQKNHTNCGPITPNIGVLRLPVVLTSSSNFTPFYVHFV